MPQTRPTPLHLAAVALAGLMATAAPATAEPDPETIVNAFEAALGPIRTHRPSHPKGVCAAGHFTATSDGTRLSVAPVFSGQRNSAIIRFGVAGANPNASDSARGTRGLSIRFESPAGDLFEMANISAPVFGADSAQTLVNGLLSAPTTLRPGGPTPRAWRPSRPMPRPTRAWATRGGSSPPTTRPRASPPRPIGA